MKLLQHFNHSKKRVSRGWTAVEIFTFGESDPQRRCLQTPKAGGLLCESGAVP